ncbi:MAG: class I SAM-dependent methyltransferase [Kordiimonadaceae bacterium]|nr:class I SAM-dependent methyltransferase [Kordiimonadaceae bacterium]
MLNEKTTEEFAGLVVSDVAAAISGVLTNIGHKKGLYKALAGAGAITSSDLAVKTGTNERYVREWLNNQTAGGYVHYNEDGDNYYMPDAYIPILADEESPFFLIPALEVAASLWIDEDKLLDIFESGDGLEWGAHHHKLSCGSESLFRPGYKTFLVAEWIAAVSGLSEKLSAGARIADVGCGHGASTILMAEQFPASNVVGYDLHDGSIKTAISRANDASANDNIDFKVASAKNYQENDYDLICFMDCLHDMGDPVGAAKHAREALKDDGVVLLVEPAAGDTVPENINPVGRLYYGVSTVICTPCSKSQEVGAALGAQAGEKRLSEVMKEAGFSSVERVAQTPFNIILAARP